MKMIPIYLDRDIIDITRLMVMYGSFSKRFVSYEEMVKWKMKAKKLEGGDIYHDLLLWKQKYYDLL